VFSQQSIQEKPEAAEYIKSAIRRNSVRGMCSTLLALAARTDTSDTLKDIKVPTLLVRGSEDRITSAEDMQELNTTIPDAKFIEPNGRAHLPNWAIPEPSNRAITELLTAIN